MFVLMLNVGAYSQVKFEKNEYAEFESSVLVGDDPINLPESAALVERMKIFFILPGIRSTDASHMPWHHPKGPHAQDTVNQIPKTAVEVDQIPSTITKLAVEQLQGSS